MVPTESKGHDTNYFSLEGNAAQGEFSEACFFDILQGVVEIGNQVMEYFLDMLQSYPSRAPKDLKV